MLTRKERPQTQSSAKYTFIHRSGTTFTSNQWHTTPLKLLTWIIISYSQLSQTWKSHKNCQLFSLPMCNNLPLPLFNTTLPFQQNTVVTAHISLQYFRSGVNCIFHHALQHPISSQYWSKNYWLIQFVSFQNLCFFILRQIQRRLNQKSSM